MSQEKAGKALMEGIFTGMPACLYLEQFGNIVWDAFGHPPYLTGSCLMSKQWRDVDVRLILPDEEYEALFGATDFLCSTSSGKWAAWCMAFAELGRKMTGLPIDFQIQPQTRANEKFDGPRQAIGLIELRFLKTP
jgi:hypothetical protein